ncbi:unnamed protein product [Spodoptera littoralis]|uniref:Uncharacterized protein n=1 Tax=Spodoptera littoralis TaxID=7109 RepID=A0A9P0N7Y6_SPOLI|nr:unnamed protein product [Spodoptera littoralis]CAH1643071.1 unnamed protein product [Spodoptera littoralis]
MAGEGMVAVVRGLRDAGLAVTLLDVTAPASTQRHPTNANASTQPIPRIMSESSTESAALHCDRDAQAVDGRYASMYKTMHCNVRPTSPPVQLTEFPPQRPDLCPGHGNFQVGGNGSGVVNPHGKPTSSSASFRGGLSWPDRGSVCSARPSMEVDAFANSLRKYPCLSPERSSEVMERLINYQGKGYSKTSTRNQASPTRIDSYPCSYHTLESKGTYTKSPRLYDQEITPRRRMEEPTRERKREDSYDIRNMRNFEVRSVRDMTRKGRDNPYCNPACPTIKETQDYQPIPQEYQNSSNSVNMEIQAAVKMISKEVATVQRDRLMRKTVAVPESPTMSATEDNVEDNSMSYFKKETIRRENTITEPINCKTKNPDDDCDIFNIKCIQTAFSNVDIRTTKYCEIRSKSQEELTKITQKQEVIKRRDHSGDFEPDMTEWFEIHSDKVKVKLWGDKLKKLADKLKRPGGEEKIRNKIEKYLKQVPEQFSDGDDDKLTLRKQLPNDIIRKLKKMKSSPMGANNINVYRMELSKYCSRFKVENFRKAVLNWTKTLNIKRKDFLGRNVKKEDVLKYIADRLEPIVLDRPQSDATYKAVLKSNITDMIKELPLVLNTHNNEFYLNKITENLVNDIFNIETKFPSTYIQPTIKEIKEFVKDEITFFLEKSRVAISTKRMEYLELELIDILLDLVNATDIDEYVMEDITTLFKVAGKLPEYKAKYFTNLLLKDYKEFFFRESFFQVKGNSDHGRPDVYSVFHNLNGTENANEENHFSEYTQHLINTINKWISQLNILNNEKKIIEVIVRDLANDIVDRHKFLLLNPNNQPTDFEELEYLKFLVFKWTNKLLGERNITILEHADQLMHEIKNIPKPVMENACPQSTITPDTDGLNDKSYTDTQTEQILKWYLDMPSELQLNENIDPIESIKHLVEEIENGLSNREDGVIDKAVTKWIETGFKNKLNTDKVQQLTSKLKSVPYTKENTVKDPKNEKVLIRSYEDLVDDWIDTVPLDPKKVGIFTDNKNEIVHDIAVKISKIKTKIKNTPLEVMQRKLSQELSYWLKKLPLHAKVDKETFRDKYAEKLVQKLQFCNVEESLTKVPVMNNVTFQIEEVLLEWLKRRPFYKNKTTEVRKHQEEIIKELGNKIKAGGYKNPYPDEYVLECIKRLEPKQNEDIVQNIACQLKLFLDKFNIKDCNTECTKKNSILNNNIELWLNKLPLHVTDENVFKEQKAQLIESIQLLKTLGCDSSIMKKEILIFMKSLPMNREKKEDIHFMNQEASNLIEHLKEMPANPVTEEITDDKPKNETGDIIKEWVNSLPLKAVYCPRELNSFLDDMTSVINRIILDSNTTEQHNEELHKEIVKFLRRFPLESDQNTENHMTTMAETLIKSLNKSLPPNKTCTETNVTVYALKNTNLTAFGLPNVQDSDINENSKIYTKQLTSQIGEWLANLGLSTALNDSYRQDAIKDLAGDIVDRHKYLELNPSAKENELEHLKYQIFKWINKLVGEDNLKTITHADDLMHRINKIPVPMLVRPQDKIQAQSAFSNARYRSDVDSTVARLSLRVKNSINTTTSPIEMNPWQQVYLQQVYIKTGEASYSPRSGVYQTNSPTNLSNASHSHSYSSSYSQSRPPDEGTKEAVYEKYQKIFKDKCNALPIDSSTAENAKLAELAKTAIYNGIIKTFFNLKANPEIENDYGYFELMLEEKIDEMLDVLPQSSELVNQRHAWKVGILTNSLDMLEQLHSFSDRPSFRQRVRNKFNRKFAKELELEQCFLLQQGFLAEMADAYILETNYKEKDEVKANIYKKRLMKKVDNLANHLAKEHSVGFRFFDKDQLTHIAMKVLEQVPKPGDEILQEEAEEIQLGDEVEKWYKDLPTKPLVNDTDGVLRKRMMDLLAKKLYDIHKRFKDDESLKEMKMKHEISMFLEKRAQLQGGQDLNINAMVDDLNDRLKNRWLKEPQDYEEFERGRPISSSYAQVNNRDISCSSTEAGTCTGGPPQDEEYFIRPVQQIQNMNSVHSPSGASYYSRQEQSGRQSYGPIYVQNPSYANESPKGNTYASNLSTNHAPQSVPRYNTDPRHSLPPYATCAGPETCFPPPRGSYSMQEHRGSIMRTNNNYGPNQYAPKHVTLPNTQRPNLSQIPGTSGQGQAYVSHQNPNLSQNVANNVPNRHGIIRSNQMSPPRNGNVSQQQSQSPHIHGPPRQNPNMLQVPNYQRPSQGTPTARYGSPGNQGPSSQGGATADGEDDNGEYRCRCLGLFRPRRMCFDQHSEMYHPCPR